MDPDRLTGFVYPVKKNGLPVRGRFQLWVNLPPEPAFDRDGQPVLDAKGRQKQRYPKTTKVIEAKGKKAAERLLETKWIAELETHRTIDPDTSQRDQPPALTSTWGAASSTWPVPSRGTRTAPSSSTRPRTARRGWCRCPPGTTRFPSRRLALAAVAGGFPTHPTGI